MICEAAQQGRKAEVSRIAGGEKHSLHTGYWSRSPEEMPAAWEAAGS